MKYIYITKICPQASEQNIKMSAMNSECYETKDEEEKTTVREGYENTDTWILGGLSHHEKPNNSRNI